MASAQETEDANLADQSDIQFIPPLYEQRYQEIVRIARGCKPKKVVDIGCGELKVVRLLKFHRYIHELIGLDVDGDLLQRHAYLINPLAASYLDPLPHPFVISLLQGSIAERDCRLLNCDLAVCVEVIEHLYPDDLAEASKVIFGYMRPLRAVFTTPNSEFNVLFPRMEGFRHDDHKFEWTRSEFQDWGNAICSEYGYTVEYSGLGTSPEGSEHLGFCTQMAIFDRTSLPGNCSVESADEGLEPMMPYKEIAQAVYHSRQISDEDIVFEAALRVRQLLRDAERMLDDGEGMFDDAYEEDDDDCAWVKQSLSVRARECGEAWGEGQSRMQKEGEEGRRGAQGGEQVHETMECTNGNCFDSRNAPENNCNQSSSITALVETTDTLQSQTGIKQSAGSHCSISRTFSGTDNPHRCSTSAMNGTKDAFQTETSCHSFKGPKEMDEKLRTEITVPDLTLSYSCQSLAGDPDGRVADLSDVLTSVSNLDITCNENRQAHPVDGSERLPTVNHGPNGCTVEQQKQYMGTTGEVDIAEANILDFEDCASALIRQAWTFSSAHTEDGSTFYEQWEKGFPQGEFAYDLQVLKISIFLERLMRFPTLQEMCPDVSKLRNVLLASGRFQFWKDGRAIIVDLYEDSVDSEKWRARSEGDGSGWESDDDCCEDTQEDMGDGKLLDGTEDGCAEEENWD